MSERIIHPEPDQPRTVTHPRRLPTPPLWITDDEGRIIGFHSRGDGPRADETETLVNLYMRFDSGDRAQGLPPTREDAIRRWLDSVQDGIHVLAWDGPNGVGHAMLVPDTDGTYELAIFVRSDYQGAGIGSMLLPALLGYGRTREVESVWLAVEPRNRPAVELYLDYGFEVVESNDLELEMAIDLS